VIAGRRGGLSVRLGLARVAAVRVAAVVIGVVLACSTGCSDRGGGADRASRDPLDTIALPEPRREGDRSLEQVLVSRRSLREYAPRPLTRVELGQLLFAAQGITSEDGKRAAPSAGRAYPIELHVVTPEGHFRYRPDGHRLDRFANEDLREPLHRACNGQAAVLAAPATFVLCGVFDRTTSIYRDRRAPQYVFVEAGHVAQNLLLQATALGLGGVPMGGFDPAAVRRVLGLSNAEEPLYVVPVGAVAAGGEE